jgi:hypothetical protein
MAKGLGLRLNSGNIAESKQVYANMNDRFPCVTPTLGLEEHDTFFCR